MEPTTEVEAEVEIPEQTDQPDQAPEQVSNEEDVQDEATESPAEVAPVEEEVEEEPPFPINQPQPTVNPLTEQDLKLDENGNVDIGAFLGTVNERINQAQQGAVSQTSQMVEVRERYKSEWDKAEEKYPELKSNKQLKELVYATHADSLERQGKWKSPTKAADEIFKLIKASETKGIETAQKNVEVQKSASLETSSSSQAPVSSVNADVQSRLNSTDPSIASAARRQILAQRIRDGNL